MTTVANSKNTFSKRIEITQIGSHQSESRLQSIFLDKPENYTLQIEKFIVDTTPTINLIEGPYFQILERPGEGTTSGGDLAGFVDTDDIESEPINFTPVSPKSILDVFHQLEVFCKDHDGLTVAVSEDYKLSFTLTAEWGDEHYLKLNTVFADLMLLPEYIYYFARHNRIDQPFFADDGNIHFAVSFLQQSGNGYIQNNLLFYSEYDAIADLQIRTQLEYTEEDEFLFAQSAAHNGGPVTIASLDTLRSLDTRISYDVSCSFPSDSKVEVLQGDGNYRRLTARFPIGDVLEDYTTVSSNEDYSLTEKINVGVTDITRSNPNTQTLNLHQGEIQNVNTDIIIRYLEDKKMRRVPADFGDTGFFTLGLLFSKRIK